MLWRNSYEREVKDVFAVQAEIAKSIASALHVTLSDAKPIVAKTTNIEAHDVYLRGRFEHEKYTGEGIRRAIALYDSAIRLNPRYGDPRAGLATAWINLADDWIAPKQAFPRAVAAAKAALELDSTNAGAYLALLAGTKFTTPPEVRRKELHKVVPLAPNDPSTLALVSMELLPFDQLGAIRLAKRAYMLDSTSQTTTIYYSVALALVGGQRKRCPLSKRPSRETPGSHLFISFMEKCCSSLAARARLWRRIASQSRRWRTRADGMARSYVALGQRENALKLVKAMEADAAKRYVSRITSPRCMRRWGEG